MSRFTRVLIPAAVLMFAATATGSTVQASEPGWSPVVIARGPYRQQIESTPMHLRPNRPLHFYGNTVRRQYYRGNPLPTVGDLSQTVRVLVTRSAAAPVR